MTPNCSSLFSPPVTPMLQHVCWHVWQTSLLGQLHITSSSTFITLNSSSCRGKTARALTCQSLSRRSQYHHHQLQRSWEYSLTVAAYPEYAPCLGFNLPKFSHLTSLLCDLYWFPVAARIRFKTMVLAFKAIDRTAPTYLKTLVRPHAPAPALQSTTSVGRLVPLSLRAINGHSAKLRLCSGGPMSGQQSHSPSSGKDSRLIWLQTSPRPSIAWHTANCMSFYGAQP